MRRDKRSGDHRVGQDTVDRRTCQVMSLVEEEREEVV